MYNLGTNTIFWPFFFLILVGMSHHNFYIKKKKELLATSSFSIQNLTAKTILTQCWKVEDQFNTKTKCWWPKQYLNLISLKLVNECRNCQFILLFSSLLLSLQHLNKGNRYMLHSPYLIFNIQIRGRDNYSPPLSSPSPSYPLLSSPSKLPNIP